MKREEFQKEYRKWRSVLSHISIPEQRGMTNQEKKAAWQVIWDGIYSVMPKHIEYALLDRRNDKNNTSWGISSSSKMKCNYSCLPNSYPHKTKKSLTSDSSPSMLYSLKQRRLHYEHQRNNHTDADGTHCKRHECERSSDGSVRKRNSRKNDQRHLRTIKKD